MNADMSVMLAPTPKATGKATFGAEEEAGQEEGGKGSRTKTKRRSFVLEPGLTLVDSDEDE